MLNNPEVTSATSEISLNHCKGNKNFPSCATFSTENTTFFNKILPPPLKMDIYAYMHIAQGAFPTKKRGWLIKKFCEYQNCIEEPPNGLFASNSRTKLLSAFFLPIIKDVCTQKNHKKTGIKNRDFTTRYKKYAKKCNYLYISIYKRPNQKAILRVSAIGFNPILTYIYFRGRNNPFFNLSNYLTFLVLNGTFRQKNCNFVTLKIHNT